MPKTGSRRSRRRTTSSPTPSCAPLRRVRRRLPAGARGRRPRHLGTSTSRSRCRPGAPRRTPVAAIPPTASGSPPAIGGVDFDDLFGDIFGGRRAIARGARSPAPTKRRSSRSRVEEAFRGGRRTITLPGPDGPRTLDVNIPPGVTDGQRIRLAGQGGQGTGQAPPGDLYLVVRIAPHPRYRVEGRDIFVELPLAPWEAALGATVAVETPGGEAKVRVPQGTSCGPPLAAEGQRPAEPAGRARRPLRRGRASSCPQRRAKTNVVSSRNSRAMSTFDPRRQR